MNISSLSDLIARAGENLTPSEQRIAQVVLDQPTLLAFGGVADLAQRVDTSRPTVVRFAQTLGFPGYVELQTHVQNTMVDAFTTPSRRIRVEGSASSADKEALLSSLDQLFDHLTDERIESLVRPLIDAQTIFVLSGETSRAGANAMASGLMMLRSSVVFVEDHAAGSMLNSAGDRDAAVVFDFHRYRRSTSEAVRYLKQERVAIVAITDGPLSPLAAAADVRCDVVVPAVGPFDSSMPAVAAAELMTAAFARATTGHAVASIDRTEAAWAATDTFLKDAQ